MKTLTLGDMLTDGWPSGLRSEKYSLSLDLLRSLCLHIAEDLRRRVFRGPFLPDLCQELRDTLLERLQDGQTVS